MKKLLPYLLIFALTVTGTILATKENTQEPVLSAALPGATALFETSLASPITSSATSMTLTANSVRGGGSISGFNCFTIDEGSSQHEVVCGTVSGTAVSSMTRGISLLTGTTTDADNQFSHRRGANVKITDFPLVQILKAQANGEDTYPNSLSFEAAASYTSALAFTPGSNQLITALYADSIANQGAATSSETAAGISQLATATEQASSTDLGVNDPLVLQAKNATSSPTYSCNSSGVAGALCTVIADNAGKIKQAFLDIFATANTWSLLQTFTSGITSLATTTISANSGSALVLNGISYIFPSTPGTNNQIIKSDGGSTQTLSFVNEYVRNLDTNWQLNSAISGTNVASTTIFSSSNIGNILNSTTYIEYEISAPHLQLGASCFFDLTFGNGSATSSIFLGDIATSGYVTGRIIATSSASMFTNVISIGGANGTLSGGTIQGVGYKHLPYSTSGNLYMAVIARISGGPDECSVDGYSIKAVGR